MKLAVINQHSYLGQKFLSVNLQQTLACCLPPRVVSLSMRLLKEFENDSKDASVKNCRFDGNCLRQT